MCSEYVPKAGEEASFYVRHAMSAMSAMSSMPARRRARACTSAPSSPGRRARRARRFAPTASRRGAEGRPAGGAGRGRERWYTGSITPARQSCPKSIGAEPLEDAPLGHAILTRHETRDRLKELLRHLDPPRAARLRHGRRHAPAATWLVDVTPRQALELRDAHARRVEHERRQAVGTRQQTHNRLYMLGCWRFDLATLLAGQLDGLPVAGRIRLKPASRAQSEHAHRFADRLLTQLRP